jgi:hypothetical protein
MKKLTPTLELTLRGVELYLEDIQTLLDLAKELGVPITLQDGDFRYEFSDAEDIKGLGLRKIESLIIMDSNTCGGHFVIWLFESFVTLKIREIDNAAYGIFKKIESFLRSKQKHSNWFIRNWRRCLNISTGIVIVSSLAFYLLIFMHQKIEYVLSAFAISVLATFLMVAFIRCSSRNIKTIIHIENRPQQLSTWQSISKRLDIPGALPDIFRKLIWTILCTIGGAISLYIYQNWPLWLKP